MTKTKTKTRITRPIATAYLADAPLRLAYRDEKGKQTTRVVRIEELHQDYIVARCLLRDGHYRRFNFDRIQRAKVIRPSLVERARVAVRSRFTLHLPHAA
jgi:predicted DNA-binding transcriptional regulator YafY